MRLGVVSARYPYAPTEAYLGVELAALGARLEFVTVAAATPGRRPYHRSPADVTAMPTLGPRMLLDAAASLLVGGSRTLRAIAAMLGAPSTLRIRAKNLAVVPRALALARAFRRKRIDHVHGYWLSTASTIAYLIARTNDIPFSATGHRWDIYEGNALAAKLQAASFVRAISERGAADLKRAAPLAASVRVMRLGVGIPASIAPRGTQAGRLRLLCAAELLPVKGHPVLIDAIARARAAGVDVTCDLAGRGPEHDAVARAIASHSLDGSVVLRGNVPHPQLLAALHDGAYDAAILTSIEEGTLMEGVPVALLEAMAAGVPCIATASGSVPELVDATCGAIAPVADPEAVAAAIVRFARDPALRARLGDAARERIARAFDQAAATREFAEALEASARDDQRR